MVPAEEEQEVIIVGLPPSLGTMQVLSGWKVHDVVEVMGPLQDSSEPEEALTTPAPYRAKGAFVLGADRQSSREEVPDSVGRQPIGSL